MEILVIFKKIFVFLALLGVSTFCFAQETTGSLQGTVKDPTGASVPGATVSVTTPTLVGVKTEQTDAKGYYHFSNLPPGAYVVTVDAKGFKTLNQSGLIIEVGHSPTLDLSLAVGGAAESVDVTAQTPSIDVTSVTTLTNVTQDVLSYVPRGTSFQSVIQFAPSARNEPLMGNTTTNGSGSVSPGNGSNGSSFGYSIAGGSDSENSYLVEGQETANLIGGYSHTSVPFDFIDQVEIKSSGVQAEYGGALGGVINVIMKKGTSHYHGSAFILFENQSLDAGPNPTLRYDPLSSPTPQYGWTSSILPSCVPNPPPVVPPAVAPPCYGGLSDATAQFYQPTKDHYSDIRPGFTFGGPLLPFSERFRDKIFFFVGFNPDLNRDERKVNYGPASAGNPATGIVPFSQNTNTYYTTARIDAQASKKIRVFGSWLYQLQKQHGEQLPFADSIYPYNFTTGTGQFNLSSGNDPAIYGHSLGFTAPNLTVNTGADIAISPSVVSTTRFGYYFENYHDFGYPTGGVVDVWETNGLGHTQGYQNGILIATTRKNASKAIEVDQDFAWYKSTKFGTHNFKFGYQMNRNSNDIIQVFNQPEVQLFPGTKSWYDPQSPLGQSDCATISASLGTPQDANGGCQGPNGVGYAQVYDFGTSGHATAYDNGFYGQDSWTAGRGITIDAGIRAEKEFLPGESFGGNAPQKPINFGWKDKIAPRIGVAWDVFRNGKMKIFGGYGQFYDQMKLNVAISSFGGQYWNNCTYIPTDSNVTSLDPAFNSSDRYCPAGNTSTGANFAGGTAPTNMDFVENINLRAFPTTCATCSADQEGVAPGLKPYEQHESLAGVDYQLTPTLALEVRYDRRRLDHVIEDAAVYSATEGETFVIVNPGQGVNGTVSGYCNFLYGIGSPSCSAPITGYTPPPPGSAAGTNPTPIYSSAYPPNQNPQAARSYDGVEFRVTKAMSHNWYGMFSYTYSHFRGNYTGLTSSDLSDGGSGGRNSPNNSRAFDEPYFQYNANGGSSSGLLPTDRPNTLKFDAYYQLKYLHRFTTNLGMFQYFYEGSPNTSYADVGLSYNAFPVKLFDWGKWADITQNPNTGAITVGTPYTYRNPWYNQTDLSLEEQVKMGESKAITFQATATNLLNGHAVTAVYSQIDSNYYGNNYIEPNGQQTFQGIPFYAAAMTPYNVQSSLNGESINGTVSNSTSGPETINSQYGKPLYHQLPRTLRLQLTFTF
jgi:hypothetical protein